MQSDQSLCLSLEYSMTVKLLTGHHLESLRVKGGCTGSSESTLVKMPHRWKSHITAQISVYYVLALTLIVLTVVKTPEAVLQERQGIRDKGLGQLVAASEAI